MDDERAVKDLLHWVWSCQLQIARFTQDLTTEWNEAVAAETDVEARKRFSKTTFDEHMVFVAARHVLRAVEQVGEAGLQEQLPDENLTRAIELLRNIREHWDEQRERFSDPDAELERSGKRFAELYPDANPWSSTITAKGYLKLGDVVSVDELMDALNRLEEVGLSIEERNSEESK